MPFSNPREIAQLRKIVAGWREAPFAEQVIRARSVALYSLYHELPTDVEREFTVMMCHLDRECKRIEREQMACPAITVVLR